jgi:hypothetical protein
LDGKGEWKGAFSDRSKIWEKLLLHSGVSLPRTNANDGTFWIGYDDFLMGFSNIDVVLAFQGNHAKSFITNFAPKKSNHRCVRAYEVCLIDPQPGIETKEQVEVYVMIIQKSRRGARQGRTDRKKSYKLADTGLLVGECPLEAYEDDTYDYDNPNLFSRVHGQMFGFQRNCHYRLLLDRNECKRMVVMPISFGHPAATDKSLSFVVRFNADSPLMIRELPSIPRIDRLFCTYFFQTKPPSHMEVSRQGQQGVLLETSHYRIVQINCLGNGGGTLFLYLCSSSSATVPPISFKIVAKCRGMSCRTVTGLLEHTTIAKGQIFEASWRQYEAHFEMESKSRLLMVLFQSGQDTEVGAITCTRTAVTEPMGIKNISSSMGQSRYIKETTLQEYWKTPNNGDNKVLPAKLKSTQDEFVYNEEGIFHPVSMDESMFARSVSNQLVPSASNDVLQCEQNGGSNFAADDTDLQKAIELSQMDLMNHKVAAGDGGVVTINELLEDFGAVATQQVDFLRHDPNNEEMDLKRAIELSMMDETNNIDNMKRTKKRTIRLEDDLSADNNVATYQVDLDCHIVHVLDDADTGNNKGAIDRPMNDKVGKKVPTIPTEANQNDQEKKVVFDLTDSDEIQTLSQIAVSSGQQQQMQFTAAVDTPISISIGTTTDHTTKNEDSIPDENARQSKRALAAQAALRRIEGHQS